VKKRSLPNPIWEFPAASAFFYFQQHLQEFPMAQKPLTAEQRARRAEIARTNGAKSRGPKTIVGKYISSLNSIITGEHLGRLEAEIPPSLVGCSPADWQVYRRYLQINARQMQPASECEMDLIRQIAVHSFHVQRILRIERTLRQASEEKLLASYAELSANQNEAKAYHSSMGDDKMWRALQRDRKSHESSVVTYRRMFRQLRRDTPMVPAEPVSVAVDMLYEEDPLPPPHIVAEALEHAEKAESEPSHVVPAWVPKFLQDKELLEMVAARDNLKLQAGRLIPPKRPKAA
jgi:hypothetical protein